MPSGTREIEAGFQYASPQSRDQGRITATPEIVGVQWEKMLLYPAGHYASRIEMAASLTLPQVIVAGVIGGALVVTCFATIARLATS